MSSTSQEPSVNDSATPEKKTRFRRLMEFKGVREWNFDHYQNQVRDLYDGPKGAALALSSLVSLHSPLMGHVIRSGKFDASQCKSLLDVGSGAGQILKHLLRVTQPDARIVGFDLSHEMLKRARTRLKDDRTVLMSSDMTRLPFADNSFDCVTCGFVLEYLPEPSPALREFGRVLMPGGRLLLLVTEDTPAGFMTSHTWKCRTYSRSELQAACEDAGLPWTEELWFTRVHRALKMGGILVEATKKELT